MEKKNILVPTDFSHESMPGVNLGIQLACMYDARLLVIHVMQTQWYDITGVAHTIGSLTDKNWLLAHRRLQHFCDTLSSNGIPVVPVLRQGAPAEEIVRTAREEGGDLIILSARRPGNGKPRPKGRIREEVQRIARCEVWVVEPPAPLGNRAQIAARPMVGNA